MKIRETFSRVSPFLISLALLTIPLLTTSCDRSADCADGELDDPSAFAVQLTIQTPTITTYATDGYEDGAVWENYIAFLCGTKDANTVGEIGSISNYVFNGNWTDEETDNLWGAVTVTD